MPANPRTHTPPIPAITKSTIWFSEVEGSSLSSLFWVLPPDLLSRDFRESASNASGVSALGELVGRSVVPLAGSVEFLELIGFGVFGFFVSEPEPEPDSDLGGGDDGAGGSLGFGEGAGDSAGGEGAGLGGAGFGFGACDAGASLKGALEGAGDGAGD